MGLRSGLCVMAASGLCAAVAIGCGGGGDDDSGAPEPNMPAGNAGSSTAGGGAGNGSASGGNGATPGNMGGFPGISGGPSASPDGNKPEDITPDDITPPPMEVLEMLDDKVDWKALTIIFPTMYSAYDGVHTFQVPAHVDGATVELSGWQAIPSGSVSFDPDPDVEGGVLITIEQATPEITIAASAGPVGGTAALFITMGTPEQWTAGEKRYNNGVEFTLDIDFSMVLLDPNWMPPPPPADLACNNCHTTGAKYFEIQHTPTQAARFSDADLQTIFTMGTKPEGVGFRLLPEMLGSMTNKEIYAQFHKWEASADEIKALTIYLRSLTPTGQGDIRLPDGTYVAPGDPLPMMP